MTYNYTKWLIIICGNRENALFIVDYKGSCCKLLIWHSECQGKKSWHFMSKRWVLTPGLEYTCVYVRLKLAYPNRKPAILLEIRDLQRKPALEFWHSPFIRRYVKFFLSPGLRKLPKTLKRILRAIRLHANRVPAVHFLHCRTSRHHEMQWTCTTCTI